MLSWKSMAKFSKITDSQISVWTSEITWMNVEYPPIREVITEKVCQLYLQLILLILFLVENILIYISIIASILNNRLSHFTFGEVT